MIGFIGPETLSTVRTNAYKQSQAKLGLTFLRASAILLAFVQNGTNASSVQTRNASQQADVPRLDRQITDAHQPKVYRYAFERQVKIIVCTLFIDEPKDDDERFKHT
ncbi:MAG: hypothetical protein R2867_11945 [Caldilineaceae bacterium]